MQASDVSAVIVTRGNCSLKKILATLPYDDVIIWDNSRRDQDAKTYGRHLAVAEAKHSVIYTQDDDLIFEQHDELLAGYQPGVLAGSMNDTWSNKARRNIPNGYDDLIFPGAGSVYDSDVPLKAIDRYLAHFPLDDFFRVWVDCFVGILAPHVNLGLTFQALPCSRAAYRIARMPNNLSLKRKAILRARWVRDFT